MKREISVLAILLLLAAGLCCLILSKKTPSPTPPSAVVTQPLPVAKPANASSKKIPVDVPAMVSTNNSFVPTQLPATNLAATAGIVAPLTDAGAPTGIPPQIVMANVRTAIRQYNQMWGGNPVGTNPEITAALNGNNPKHINFINADAGMRLNDKGEMIDAWGTPYFFHQVSGADTEIHSAGPDKIMWTSDDLVVK